MGGNVNNRLRPSSARATAVMRPAATLLRSFLYKVALFGNEMPSPLGTHS
jgi:hypothetical protein